MRHAWLSRQRRPDLRGIAGMRAVWLEWLAPWESYRTEIEDAIDAGDKVVVLVRDYGLRAEETNEVMLTSAAVSTVREAKITCIEFCADRATALRAVGLEE